MVFNCAPHIECIFISYLSHNNAPNVSTRKEVSRKLCCIVLIFITNGSTLNIANFANNFRYSYIAVVPGILPRRNELFHFNQGEVVENFNTLSFFRGLSYKVKDRTMLLVPERFRRAVDLFDMLNAADSKKYQYDSKKN